MMTRTTSLLPFLVAAIAVSTAAGDGAPIVGRIQLSPEGLDASRIGLGTLHFATEATEAEEVLDVLHTCLDVGITTLDLADIYSYNKSALLLGEAFKLEPDLREHFQLVYKTGIFFPADPVQYIDSSSQYLERAVRIALDQLNTTYIDVLMTHAPDLLMDPKEVAETFKKLEASGKVKYFGVSNMAVSQFKLLQGEFQKLGLSITTQELECSVLTPTAMVDGRLDFLHSQGVAPLAWGPLGGDPLGGINRLFNFDGDRQTRIRKALQEVAAELGPDVTEDQVGVAFLLRHPANIVPLLGTTNTTRLRQQAQAINLQLTRKQWTKIMGASATDNYQRWEQLHAGNWHDVMNDWPNNAFGTPLGVDPPVGFCDFDSCKAPKPAP